LCLIRHPTRVGDEYNSRATFVQVGVGQESKTRETWHEGAKKKRSRGPEAGNWLVWQKVPGA
jgi:hypothetical protein